jgi:SAM-dependent methyltransferase
MQQMGAVVSFTERPDCRLCGAAIDKVLDLGSTPLANEYPEAPIPDQDRFPLYLAECRDCGHIQLPVVVDPERLYRDYRYASGTTIAFRQHLERLAKLIIERGPLAANDLVVDIGSNDGTLLEEFQGRGMRVVGVDPALNLAGEASGRGVLTIPSFFNSALAERISALAGQADAITALNVFAHSDDLTGIATGIKDLLADGGTCVIEVGSSGSIVEGIFDLAYHEHIAFWHLSPLTRFLAKHGLAVRSAETVASQGGSIRAWIGHAENDVADPERPTVNWEAVRANVEQRRMEIRKAVLSAGRVALYGVPAKATTLLHYCGLTDAIECAYDDNPLKVGRFVPGTGIEIRSTERLYAEKPDALLLAAWNFADEIMAKRAGYRGKWVVPFSEVRVA